MALKKSDKIQTGNGIQESFITSLKERIPPGIGLAEEISAILNLSIDSSYRRIRGETELTLDEIYEINKKYPFSLDHLFSNKSGAVTFTYTKLTDSAGNFEEYLSRLVDHLKLLNRFENRKIYYVAEEMPLFYSFYSPAFADFKLFYWQRSVLNCKEYQQSKYKPGLMPASLVETATNCFKEYLTIPSVEVWTDLTVVTGLRQVGFYFDSGVIDKDTALMLLQEYRKTMEMFRRMAETGRKNISDQNETLQLYNSELVLGTNCIYTMMGEAKYSFISFNTLNSLTTSNSEFCEETEHWMRNLEKKGTLISGTGEKQRYQFFNLLFRRIDEEIARVSQS